MVTVCQGCGAANLTTSRLEIPAACREMHLTREICTHQCVSAGMWVTPSASGLPQSLGGSLTLSEILTKRLKPSEDFRSSLLEMFWQKSLAFVLDSTSKAYKERKILSTVTSRLMPSSCSLRNSGLWCTRRFRCSTTNEISDIVDCDSRHRKGHLQKLSHATAVPLCFMMLYLYPVLDYPGLPRQCKSLFWLK